MIYKPNFLVPVTFILHPLGSSQVNWFARWLGKLNTTFIPGSYRSKRRVSSPCITTWNEACQQFKANCPNFYVKTTLPFRFSYDELSAAVKERYCEDESTIKHYLMLLIEYFDAILKVKIEKNDSYVTVFVYHIFHKKGIFSSFLLEWL